MSTTKEQTNSLNEQQDEYLARVQDAFPVALVIAKNVLNRALGQKPKDDYLIGGIEELIKAIQAIQEAVSMKIALNGIAILDAQKEKKQES